MMQNCLGCKTWFQQGSKLPLQDLLIQLKNYTYPIKDQKHKWILLKTIVSFLNSKGGTIYIGVDDTSGQVRGIEINRKQQDQYKLFIQRLSQKIQPNIDLTNRQDIKMHFLPVLKNGNFTNKFVAKIIVNQGELSKLYCFTQRIILQNSNDKKYDDFDVIYSYKRINMGSVKQLSGYQIVSQAAYRALNPPKLANTFHQGCNPDPKDNPNTTESSPIQKQPQNPTIPQSKLQQQIQQGLLIHFTSLKDRQSHLKLQQILNNIIDKLKIIQYNISFQQQTNKLIAQFALQSQWTNLIDYLDNNLHQINQQMQNKAKFDKKQHQDNYAIYQNQTPQLANQQFKGQVNQIGTNDPNIFENPKLIHISQSLQQQINSNNNPIPQTKYQIKIIQTQPQKQQNQPNSSNKYIKLPSTIDISKSQILTITHLNTNKKTQFIEFINHLTNSQKNIKQYQKTIQITFNSQQNFNQLLSKLQQSHDINKFGFQGILRFGINTGQITLTNYNKTKYRQFKQYIEKTINQDLKRCQFNKNQNKFTLILTLKTPQKASQWLDKLIQNKQIKQFRIPKCKVQQKMKIDLVCVKPNPIIHL